LKIRIRSIIFCTVTSPNYKTWKLPKYFGPTKLILFIFICTAFPLRNVCLVCLHTEGHLFRYFALCTRSLFVLV